MIDLKRTSAFYIWISGSCYAKLEKKLIICPAIYNIFKNNIVIQIRHNKEIKPVPVKSRNTLELILTESKVREFKRVFDTELK